MSTPRFVAPGWASFPREVTASIGDGAAFGGRIFKGILNGRILEFLGESLRQAGILIVGSAIIVLGLVFILGLECGIEGSYGARTVGAPYASGAIAALCDLREVIPYAFGYMMAAKVSTGYVAELGSMRISDEIDALDVLGLDSVLYLCSTRMLGTLMVLPFLYVAGVAVGYAASYIAVVYQIGQVSSGSYFQLFWMFQNPTDFLFSIIKGLIMAVFVVLVGCYYGYNAGGGPVGVGRATAKAMVANIIGIQLIGFLSTQLFWGGAPRAPIGG